MRTALALITLVAAVALGGCGDDQTDPGEPKSTWTPTGTMEAPTTPVADPLTEAPADETARQFIERWIRIVNLTGATGDTTALLATAGPDCKTCRKYVRRVRRIYDGGGHLEGGASTVLEARHEGGDQWGVLLRSTKSSVFNSAGDVTEQFDGGPYEMVFYIAKVDGSWIMGEYAARS